MLNKFIYIATFLLLGATPAFNQKIGLGAGFGGARLTGELGDKGGLGLTYGLEGKYYLMPKLAVGAEYNSNILVYKEESNLLGIGSYGNRQFLLKAEYFLTKKKFRPYVGLGLGYSGIETPEITISDGSGSTTIPSEKKANFGISPRIGIMIGGFGIEYDYNLSGRTPKSEQQNVGTADKPFNFYQVRLKYVYELEF